MEDQRQVDGVGEARGTQKDQERGAGELWCDRWCFACHGLRRFDRDEAGTWRCHCGREAIEIVARQLAARAEEARK